MSTTFKIQYQEEVRRASFGPITATTSSPATADAPRETTWQGFRASIAQLFTLAPEDVTAVRYTDSDGDLITVNTDIEVAQLIEAFANSASPLKLVVVSRPTTANAALTDFSNSSSAMDEEARETPAPKPKSTTSSSSSASSSSSSVNIEGILQNLGPLGDHAREFLAHNPELKEEAERIAESLQSGNIPFGGLPQGLFTGCAPPFFGGSQHGGLNPFEFFAQQQQQYQPQPQQFQQQQQQQQPAFPEKLKELADMGFIDETLNLQLLRKYGGRVERVIAEIVRLQEEAGSH